MSTVWLLPSDVDSAPEATADDHLVRRSGSDAVIARVTAGGAEWLGSVPADTLGKLPGSVNAPTALTDPSVVIAVQGVASALVERGG